MLSRYGWPRIPALILVLIVTAGVVPARAQLPPDARWATLETEHFHVTFGPGLEELARHTARRAEVVYTRLVAELAHPPSGRIEIVLTDYVDISNGYATPFPGNRITLYARPPVDVLSLAYFDDWIDLVVTHELAHIFHLDLTGRIGRGLRRVFGRVPLRWPFFPLIGIPNWSVEGLATYIESWFTGTGRAAGSYHEMVLRTAVLEGAFESIDQVTHPGGTWPGGLRSYIYGSLFLAYLSDTYGPEVHRRLASATADSWLPAPLAFDRIAQRVTGKSFTTLYREWRQGLEHRYRALADSLRATGLTPTERVGPGGYHTLHPRVGPGGRLAYAAMDGRRAAANLVFDPVTGRSLPLSRRNGVGPVAWLADGALLTAQPEHHGPYRTYSDLYRVDARGERRLTDGARLTSPDPNRDGRRVVAVQAEGGSNRLVVYDLESGELRPLTAAEPAVHWAYPRWAPDGSRIAVSRWVGGEYDVVILDSLGSILHRVTADRALDLAPAWSPDGRYVVFSSDRSGIPNLYAFDLGGSGELAAKGWDGAGDDGEDDALDATAAGPALFQVTNLLTGAFFPDISPDGRWIYFSAYHADGFQLERIPFDPESWRAPAPLYTSLQVPVRLPGLAVWDGESTVAAGDDRERDIRAVVAMSTAQASDAGSHAAAAEPGPARPYSPLRTLRPHYWLPTIERGAVTGTFLGAVTGGADLIGRHSYAASVGYQPLDLLARGAFSYSYAGLGQPVIQLALARNWDGARLAPESDPAARLLEREDELRFSTTLRRRRYRSNASLTLGGEWVRRARILRDAPNTVLTDPRDRLLGATLGASFANYHAQPLSLGFEDGIGVTLMARRLWDLDRHASSRDRGYDEVSGQLTAYRGLELPGSANHILAMRVGFRWRNGPGADTFGVGGATSGGFDLGTGSVGGRYCFLPVRGFRDGDRRGTLGWSTTLEYRFPITYVRRGAGLWPIFLERMAGAIFIDAGGAGCGATMRDDDLATCSPADAGPLAAAGAELFAGTDSFAARSLRFRTGAAFPLRGERNTPQFYFLIGMPF